MPPLPSGSGRLIEASSTSAKSPLAWLTRERGGDPKRARNFVDFGLLHLKAGVAHQIGADRETLLVLLKGKAEIAVFGETTRVARASLFDGLPTAIHCGAGSELTITARGPGCEWAVLRVSNRRLRGVKWHLPRDITSEDRGAGLAQDACRRTVRTIFDYKSNSSSELVVGEVVNRAGRWSSYPPHHHPQPELYHYRFTLPQGYGHAELGDDVIKVRDGDTVEIPGGLDHAQVAAPGYGMYYLWVVRHLPRRPYTGFKFTSAHKWLLDPKQPGWRPGKRSRSRP